MSLVGVTDYTRIVKLELKQLRKLHSLSFIKCQQIWNGSRRPKGSGAIKEIVGKSLKYPVLTRWFSIHDCLSQLLRYYNEDSAKGIVIQNNTMNKMLYATASPSSNNSPFSQKEIDYLIEYAIIMEPLAMGLDLLQSDKNNSAFYGYLSPTIFTIRHKLDSLLVHNSIKILKEVVPKLSDAFTKRFKSLLDLDHDSKFATIAAVSHPNFKLRWLNETQKEIARAYFTEEVVKMRGPLQQPDQSATHGSNFFDWLTLSNNDSRDIKDEVSEYLASPLTSLQSLDNFPMVKKVFLKFNTPLPSSGTIERVFNYGGMLNDAKRNRISANNLENNIILKANQIFKLRDVQNSV